MSSSARASNAGDPYVPEHGDESYGVAHYDLELTYRPSSNRLDGVAALDVTVCAPLTRLSLDLAGLQVGKVTVDGRRSKKYVQRKNKLVITLDRPRPAGDSVHVVVSYSGHPKPIRGRWGEVGWEELHEGALVAGQPNGAPSWFPCNDRPSDKATYRIAVTTDAPFTVVANGALTEWRPHAGTATWVYERTEPMASYLAAVHVGHYELCDIDNGGVVQRIARPARLAAPVAKDFDRQSEMLRVFGELFGPYPFRTYTVVVTDDPLEIPLEAQDVVRLRRQPCGRTARLRAVDRARARAPVVRKQPHRRAMARHLAQRGVRLLRGMAVVRAQRWAERAIARRAPLDAAAGARAGPGARSTRARTGCSTTASTSAAR